MPAVPLESRLLQALAPWREAGGAGAWRFPAGWIPRCCCICSPNWPGAKPCRRCRRCMSTMACRLRRTVGRRTARRSAGRWVSRCGSSGCRSPLAAASSRRRATPAIAHSRRAWARDRCCSPRSTSTTRPRPCCSACCVERACAAWRRCRRAGLWAAAACADPCSGFPAPNWKPMRRRTGWTGWRILPTRIRASRATTCAGRSCRVSPPTGRRPSPAWRAARRICARPKTCWLNWPPSTSGPAANPRNWIGRTGWICPGSPWSLCAASALRASATCCGPGWGS